MTNNHSDKQRDSDKVRALQHHFSRRVISDALAVIDQWFRLQHEHWCQNWYEGLTVRLGRLKKSAMRYQREDLAAVSERLLTRVQGCQAGQAPDSDTLSEMADDMTELSRLTTRQNDKGSPEAAAGARQDVYIAIENPDVAAELADQLGSFGLSTQVTPNPTALAEARAYRRPLAILMDLDFHGTEGGFTLVESIQQEVSTPISILFYGAEAPSMEQRLRAMRAGGKGFIDGDAGLMRVVERLERESRATMPELYRVLVVDDSRTQATHAAQTLNSAGMITKTLAEPLALLETVDEFEPDIILMDMYMPRCNGVELATVLRQQPRYDRLPLIFLSAEEDVAKQMHAMAEGGDDFLTKPVNPAILVATVQHRCKRNRAMRNWMERDSLTGLFDHTHLLQRLQQEITKAERLKSTLSFVMLDLDRFKSVNDTWGHPVGDRVLQNLSLLLRQRLRKSDIIGRYGGEEFGVIMPDTSAEQAKAVMDELLTSFRSIRHRVSGEAGLKSINCSFSGGIAEWEPELSVSELSVRADGALYQAKEAGRSRLSIAES